RLTHIAGKLILEDLASKNGTFCNGAKVTSAVEVHDGDIIQFGTIATMKFSASDADHALFRARLLQLGARDPVTGTLQVVHMLDPPDAEFQLTQRHGVPMAVLLIDVDFLNTLNQRLGMEAGTQTLRHVASTGRRLTRREDFFARWKEDKFITICRGTNLHGA